jgi:amino acid transporter
MALVRAIGRGGLTGLVVNCIIGTSIFGMPGEVYRQLGRASPLAMLAGAFCMGIFIACAAEVASQFKEPGGPHPTSLWIFSAASPRRLLPAGCAPSASRS